MKWSASDRRSRTISPFSQVPVSEWLENRIKEGTVEGLRAATQVDPANVRVTAYLDASVSSPAEMAPPSSGTPAPVPPSPAPRKTKTPTVTIAIRLVRGRIEEIAAADAIAVGHYIGVAPQYAELAIDRAISKALSGAKSADGKLLITDLCRRGAIVGELGQNFILPDPRKPGRIIVIAGMGQPGTFGAAQLAILSRELVWALGRSGRKNLASVL